MTSVVSSASKHEVKEIVLIYRIPAIFKVYPCSENQTADEVVANKICVIIYVEHLKARFLLDHFIVVVLKLFRVSIVQIHPNG